MSAQNVWSCLLAYNGDAATTIFGRYRNTLALVLARLSSYPGRSKYHGHISGGAGDGEHAGAAENRTAAIEYLNAYTPPEEEKKSSMLLTPRRPVLVGPRKVRCCPLSVASAERFPV